MMVHPPHYQYDILLCYTLPYFYYVLQVQTITSTTPQQQQTVPTPSPPLEEAVLTPPQDYSTAGIMFVDNSFIIVNMLLYSYFKSLSLYVGECPTMIELIRFRGRSRRINIPKEIGTKCYQFGVLLLKDETGARIETVIRKHLNDAEQINMESFKLWFAGEGEQPVTWGTLVEVLRDVKLTTLASDIADVKLS